MRVAIRGFIDGRETFEDRIDITDEEIDTLVPSLAEKHGRAMADHELTMIEIEFVDDPGPDRVFRFGTDPRMMAWPMLVIDIDKERPN
jgi:hypothetical protein